MQNEKREIEALRAEMKKRGIGAYFIPSSDPHMGEYTPLHWQARHFFSGFTGSAGTLVVTAKQAGLWTDGRYFIQAERELAGSGITLFRMAVKGVPTVSEFLRQTLASGEKVGFDGRMVAASDAESMRETFEEKGIELVSEDLITPLWPQRPPLPNTEAYIYGEEYAGLSCAEKLAQVRAELKKHRADAQIYARLDCAAWLLNLRAADIKYNPLAVCYAAVFQDSAYLFIDSTRLAPGAAEYLSKNGVQCREYGAIGEFLRTIPKQTAILTDMTGTNYELYLILKENPRITVKGGPDIVENLKGIKNPVEIENIRKAMIYDGCAMAEYAADFYEKLHHGETMTEWDVCEMLHDRRAQQPHNSGASFATIAAYRENAAMMHYSPKPGACAELKQEGLLLIDSGGQYFEGTTDITRTFALGPVDEETKKHYTWVLKAHIALANAVFLEGSTGGNIDILCREPLWRHGIDYRCGTGHGVGMFAGVHEGPQNIRQKNSTVLRPGMTITNEPGIYEEGKHGIRTENMMLVTDAFANEYGKFLHFETLTLFPIDTRPLLPELLTAEEIQWLNAYHRTVFEKLSPHLEGKALAWLTEAVKPITG